ncbi:hypothetical protein PF005_g24061 [Phytophthora fragariae]|uniref:Uncharacterized protein n=1 Tax=Phytophthora fragariae TaxID=53985 RepID=A0A6A3WEV7_9STRA|nr:hypothetical protein PF005_g24061 [Phytophthora fragariae]
MKLVWSVGVFALVVGVVAGGLGSGKGTPGSMPTVVSLYDSCSQPASSVIITRELECSLDDAQTCQSTGVVATNCTNYVSGSDTSGAISEAFGDHPHLIVEEYDPSAMYCGDNNGVLNVTGYLLDDKCHVNRDGTASTKMTLGRSLTIAKYSDPNCERVVSEEEVPYGDPYDRACANNATRYLYSGSTPSMSAVTVYEDSSCSTTPVKLTVAQVFVCEAERDPSSGNCRHDGNSHYSVSSCTDDYNELAAAAFGADTPYVVVEEFLNHFCDNRVDLATVYIMDNTCHTNTDDATSFSGTLTSDGFAIITTYGGANCELARSSTDFTKRSEMCLPQRDCADGYIHGWAKRFSIGGIEGPLSEGQMTSMAIYDGGSCSAPAATLSYTREFTCTPRIRSSNSNNSASTANSTCEFNGVVNLLTDCTYYYLGWDTSGSITNAFGEYGDHPYLIVEEYDPSARYCGDDSGVRNATAYLLDEKCHVNRDGTASSKITLGRSLTINKYSDPSCESFLSETDVPYGGPYDRACANNATRYMYMGPTPPMNVITVYEDSSCSGAPVKLTMTQGFVCDAERDPSSAECRPDGTSHSSVSSCTSDYNELPATAFGNNTSYLVVEEFSNYYCGTVDSVTVYVVDSACHTNADDATSFRADCADGYIHGCAKRFSIGGVQGPVSNGQLTSVTIYDGGSCSAPAASLSFTRELTCTSPIKGSTCDYNGVVNTVTDCTNYYSGWGDTSGSISKAFEGYQYLIVEEYDPSAMYCGDNNGLFNVTGYHIDEKCHMNRDGTASTKMTLGRSLAIAKYSDPSCERVVSEEEVPYGDPYDRACANNATKYLYSGSTPSMSAVTVYEDSSCSTTPVKLTVAQGFVCEAERDPSSGNCRHDGNSHYSVSSCTDDYNELAAAAFGVDTPYVVVEEFLNHFCDNRVDLATVYIMDNTCHTNTDDATSFRATLTSDGSAIITTYADANCELAQSSTDFTKRSEMCLPQRHCADGSIHGCAKRFSVGGLKRSAPSGLMTAIAIYERSCEEIPLQVLAFPDSTCEATAMGIDGCNDWSDNWFYYSSNCIVDSTDFTASKFRDAPYLLVEKYAEGTNCGAQLYAIAYRSDSDCHPSGFDKTHFRVSLNENNSVTIATFPSGLCRDSDAETTYVTVGSSYINTSACFNGTIRLSANLTAFSGQAPSLDAYKTREQIMFPDWLWDPTPRRIFESD